jgi:ELWxxDGT repeat protein
VQGTSGIVTDLTAVNGTLYFRIDDPTTGPGLWKSDGTADGTVLVKSINATNLTAVGGNLYFSGKKAASSSRT